MASIERMDSYIRPLGYYDNPGVKLAVGFATLNLLSGLTASAATLNALALATVGADVIIDCGTFTDPNDFIDIDCGAF